MNSISIKLSPHSFFISSMAIIILLNSGYALDTTSIGNFFDYIIYVASIVLLLPCLEKKGFLNNSFLLLIFFVILLFISVIFNFSSSNIYSFISLCFKLLFAYEICSLVSFRDFSKYYRFFATYIAWFVIIAYLLYIFTSIPDNLPSVININDVEYKSAGLFFYIKYSSGISSRMQGPFWEPGLLATFILVAIALEIFSENCSYKKITLYVVVILLSQSSAGILLLFFLALIFMLRKNTSLTKVFAILVFIFLALIYINLDQIINTLYRMGFEVFEKIVLEDVSYTARIKSFSDNFELFLLSPLFGVGGVEVALAAKSQLSTSTTMLAIYGIIGSLFTIIPIISIMKIKSINILSRILLCLIFFAIYNKEPHGQILITTVFMMYGLFSLAEPESEANPVE